jgi:glycosyltransferase involved in cell wall biosynthesis
MGDRPQVSVIIPVHNSERCIEMTIRSALASRDIDLEVVAVDDGSTDQSAEIIRAIDDPRIVLLRTPASGGPARPRNIGIAHARAPYVALLDADDLLKPDKLSAAVAELDRHPEAAFTFGDFETIDGEGRTIKPSVHVGKRALGELAAGGRALENGWRLITGSVLRRALLDHNFIGTSSVVLRKSVLASVGVFDETLVFAEDNDLWFRLAYHCTHALYWEKVGNSYRIAPGSLTFEATARDRWDRITVFRREKQRRQDRSDRARLDTKIAQDFARLGYLYRRRSERWRAATAFARALLIRPSLLWLRALVGSLVRADLTH